MAKVVSNEKMMHLIKAVHGLLGSDDLEKQRQSQDSMGTLLNALKDVTIKEVNLDGMYGEWLTVNRAHMKKYVILYCHGGGYMSGSCAYARNITTKLAENTSMDVFCFEYRLAPEYPYPAATEDAMKAWNYLMLLGYGARDIVIAGDSAGGNLALSLVLRLKEEERLLPRGILLFSPWTDLLATGKTYESKCELDPVLNREYIDRAINAYAKNENLENPLISPLYGDFTGFPPTYIQVGENEILKDDSVNLHKKMIKANVAAKMDIYPGMWHVFQMTPLKKAQEACDDSAQFIFDICR